MVAIEISSRQALLVLLIAGSLALLGLGLFALLRFYPRGEGTALQKVAKNSLFPMATSFLNKFLDMAFAIYMLRELGPEGMGRYTFAVVVIGYLDIMANFGLGTLLTREVSRDRGQAHLYLGNTLVMRLGLWVLSLPLIALLLGPGAGPMGITPDVSQAILLLTLGLLPSLASGALASLFQAYEKFEYPAAVTVLTTILKIAFGIAALVVGWGIVGLAGVSVMVNLITLAVLLALLDGPHPRERARGHVHALPHGESGEGRGPGGAIPWRWEREQNGVWGVPNNPITLIYLCGKELQPGFCKKLLRLSYPLMLNNLLNSIFFRVDSLMLKPMAGDASLGWYGTAYKFIDGLGVISSSFTLALFPLFSKYAQTDREKLARTFGFALKLLLMVSLPISVGTTLIANEIISLFAGPDYLPHSAIALQILIWFLPFSFVNGVTQYLLIAVNQQRFITGSFLVATSFNLMTNLLAIPILGYAGAAITTVLSEWVLMVPFWYCVRRCLPPIPVLSLAWKPLLASALMGLEVWGLREWSLPLAVAVAPPLYGALLLALGVLDADERAMLARLAPWPPPSTASGRTL